MKIVVGASSVDLIKERIEAGADEVFCGYIPDYWVDEYHFFLSPNRRWGPMSNFMNFHSLNEAIDTTHALGKKFSLTLNAQNITRNQLKIIERLVEELKTTIVDHIIVTDIGFLCLLHKIWKDIPIHLSTGGTVFNKESVAFFRDLGVVRVIFPRALKLFDAYEIAETYPDMEFEIFTSHSRCLNIDGFCYFEHMIIYMSNEAPPFNNYSMCNIDYKVDILCTEHLQEEERELVSQNMLQKWRFSSNPKTCRACDMLNCSNHNIKYLKIPGRDYHSQEKRKMMQEEISFLRRLANKVEGFSDVDTYQKFAQQQFQKTFHEKCYLNGPYCL